MRRTVFPHHGAWTTAEPAAWPPPWARSSVREAGTGSAPEGTITGLGRPGGARAPVVTGVTRTGQHQPSQCVAERTSAGTKGVAVASQQGHTDSSMSSPPKRFSAHTQERGVRFTRHSSSAGAFTVWIARQVLWIYSRGYSSQPPLADQKSPIHQNDPFLTAVPADPPRRQRSTGEEIWHSVR